MDVLTHKCPNCDGPLTFDPDDQKFHCPYCGSIFTVDEVTEFEEKQEEARLAEKKTAGGSDDESQNQTGPPPESDSPTAADQTGSATAEETTADSDAHMELFLCPNCGAEIVTDSTTAATYCYYCHNPVVLQGRLSGKFLPDKVLPFAISKDVATEKFLEWAKQKWFVPRAFFNQKQVEKLTGVYFPYWNVNAEADGEISGMATSLRVWMIGDIEYTETKQYEVHRAGKFSFKDLIKNALSKNTQQKMVEGVNPFPMSKAVNFKNQYLAGFQAEKRDTEYEKIAGNVKQELTGYSETLLSETVGSFSAFVPNNKHLELTKEDNQYVLLPVWLVTYRTNDRSKKVYYYAMNGQTGKVAGVLPISYKKLGLTAFAIFAFCFILFMIGGYFI